MTPFAWSRLAVVAPPLLSAPSSPSLISVGSVSNTLRGKATGWTFLCIPDRFREAVLFEWAGSIWKDPD
ncbi:hypothetical protein OPV22_007862 [Ensete ventricosum]|uniref:Secreted protein n=1 Tax=Ensete ventricosum TaxID=4639 RepID=A0AAV8R7D7_ENSVE|nr:hypothetical protein OPV22_007862 [Ensete ventricosum]